MNKAKEIQQAFLARVKSTLPQHVSFVNELSELLNTSNDSAYRRLRGETLLGIDEIAIICQHFKVPFETQTQNETATVSFNYFKLDGKETNFKHWLNTMTLNVKQIAATPQGNILYAADDIPIWHHFNDEELTAFKLFYWLKNIVNDPQYAGKKYNSNLVDSELLHMAKEMLISYNQCQSTEIWSEDTINSTIKQVEYFWESGYFESKEQALTICDCLLTEIEQLKLKAEAGSKTLNENQNFKLFMSEIMIGNNSIIVDLNGNKSAYLSNNTFNMMSTTTPDFVAENEKWVDNLLRKSIQISAVSEKQRNRFFNVMFDKVKQLKSNIQ
ncbi:MAG: hypothetical protein KBE91_07065 [Bacteroidia bacterium]|nr:hypothetical protein [Bacteroidia bacterium]